MTFSADGFFGLSLCLPASTKPEDQYIMWWSTFAIEPPPEKNSLPAEILNELIKKHGHWKSPYDGAKEDEKLYSRIVTSACEAEATEEQPLDFDTQRTKMMVLPRFMIERLLHWTSYTARKTTDTTKTAGRIILLGDAAHAMPPDSGQGVSCAVEDALCLALLLNHYAVKAPSESKDDRLASIHKVALAYETIRLERIATILKFARRGGDSKRQMSFIGELVRFVMMKFLSEFFLVVMIRCQS
jgi:2-polyprenyl-6-methoxyphenol hydroxylase-like FAD-dependent oxidoreductase